MPFGAQPRRSGGRSSVRGSTRTTTTGAAMSSSAFASPAGSAFCIEPSAMSAARSGRPSGSTSRRPRRHGVGFGPSSRVGPSAVSGSTNDAPRPAGAGGPRAAPPGRRVRRVAGVGPERGGGQQKGRGGAGAGNARRTCEQPAARDAGPAGAQLLGELLVDFGGNGMALLDVDL